MIISIITRQQGLLNIKTDAIDSVEDRETHSMLTTRVGNRYDIDINEATFVKDVLKKTEGYVDANGIYHGGRLLADGDEPFDAQPIPTIPQNQQLGSHRRSDL